LRASPLAAEFCIKQISKYRQKQANEAGRPGIALKKMYIFEKAPMTETFNNRRKQLVLS
jgi:hypothetical protein